MATVNDDVTDYLRRLDDALADLPATRRREIVQEIDQHIRESITDSESEASVRDVLDRLGEPEEIASEAGARPKAERRLGPLEVAAIALLLIGGVFPPVLGWVVGVVLLWISDAWTTRHKVLGTLVVPGGLALPLFLSTFFTSFAVGVTESCMVEEVRPGETRKGPQLMHCESSSMFDPWIWTVLMILLAVAAIGMAIYLGRHARRRIAN
jgi:hypothetical protein